jgi:predicted nucleotidyltransferase
MPLNQNHLRIVTSIIRGAIPEAEIFLFGSFARGCERSDSDLDIAIRTSAQIPFETLLQLNHLFSESNLPYIVDIVDLSSVSESFRLSIEKDLVKIKTDM